MLKCDIPLKDIIYKGGYKTTGVKPKKSLQVIGLDTEAYTTGQCFMIVTSLGDVFKFKEFPACFFVRKYANKKFVLFNLKYDSGAFLQVLPKKKLRELWLKHKTIYKGYTYRVIPKKMLRISKGNRGITMYDICSFYGLSLEEASQKYLKKGKENIETVDFTPDKVRKNWDSISKYCVQDAMLAQELADILIKRFEKMGVRPQKLYSVAYVSYQYFKSHCNYPTVKYFWDYKKEILEYAMRAYNGGKFEVSERGVDYYYEYDINSAYPFEISNLLDISHMTVLKSKEYRKDACYGFMNCIMNIPLNIFSPVVVKRGSVNAYPAGKIERVITKSEYDYLLNLGVDITTLSAVWLIPKKLSYSFRKEVLKLTELKKQYKIDGKDIEYLTIKKFLNSLYGKFVQLIKSGNRYRASACWNPIYGSIITANVRIRVSELQRKYESVVAVHTDSIISKKQLSFPVSNTLGDFSLQCEGEGVIIGSGVYQIGDKRKFRGFRQGVDLLDILHSKRKTYVFKDVRPLTWSEISFHNWDTARINRFENVDKVLNVNFDNKRIWLDNYKSFRDMATRKVYSTPFLADPLLGF